MLELSLEHRLALDKLSNNASGRPNVDGCRVVSRAEHELRRAVVPRADVRDRLLAFLRVDLLSAAEVADLQDVTRRVDQKVGWLDVAMHHIVPVDVVERTEQLV